MTAPTTALSWVPPTHPMPVPAGSRWDAVRLPRVLGERVLARLGVRSGAVIEDRSDPAALIWLVPPGSVHHWRPLKGVTTLGTGYAVIVPPLAEQPTPGSVVWRLRPDGRPRGTCLTRAELLRNVIAIEVARGTDR